jgi:F0F1-type ATP synthase assembly protein I
MPYTMAALLLTGLGLGTLYVARRRAARADG